MAAWNWPDRQSLQTGEVLARRDYRVAGLLLALLLTACATSRSMTLPPPDEDPADLARHIIVLDSDGEGNGELIGEINSGNDYSVSESANVSSYLEEVRYLEDVRNEQFDPDPAVLLREQFKCVIMNAIEKHKAWNCMGRNDLDNPAFKGQRDQRFCSDTPLKIVFYFNGGLNSIQGVLEDAGNTYWQIENDRVWPTGALESYGEDVARIRAGRLTEWDDPSTLISTPGRPLSDLLRGIASTPAAWATSLFELYQTGFGFGGDAYMLKRDRNLHVSTGQPLAPNANVTIKPDNNLYFRLWDEEFQLPKAGSLPDGEPVADRLIQDGAAAVANQVAELGYYGATAPVRIVTIPPMVGLSEAGWRNMVRRTRTSVRAADEFPNEFAKSARSSEEASARSNEQSEAQSEECLPDLEEDAGYGFRLEKSLGEENQLEANAAKLRRCYPRGSGGFARVFQWLESCITEGPIEDGAHGCPLDLTGPYRATLSNVQIVMIGHSMGTIIINEILQLFPDLPYESLVYMAGAASVADTSRAVTPVLMNNLGCTNFYGLMLHPMNEARESTGWGFLPSGSLLAYVDEFLEVPKTVPDRTVGQWRNLRATRHVFFPEEARQWMLLHVFDRADGMRQLDNGLRYPNPTSHGAFNDADVPFWREKFWKPDKISFPDPDADCKAVFTSRLQPLAIEAGVGAARAITIPAEETARKWQAVWQEVEGGKTVAITSGGDPVARIVPITR